MNFDRPDLTLRREQLVKLLVKATELLGICEERWLYISDPLEKYRLEEYIKLYRQVIGGYEQELEELDAKVAKLLASQEQESEGSI
jgi:hypothetical protein